MASTSDFNTGRRPENENASQEIPATPSAPATYSVVSVFSSCFDWCSRFFSTRLDQPNSVASASTTICQSQNELTDAFQGMAPYPLSSGIKKPPYDIFINHRGPDVKKTLATTLYNILNGMGLRVFLDSEELELGDSLPKELEEAMRSASLHLAIFSKNYAQSPWCLAELSFMLKTGTQIVPVFYHIQPDDDVRYARGAFADAFSQYEVKRRHTPEKLQEWKNALYHVSYITGHIVDTEDDEVGVLKNIVNCVLKVMKTVPFVVAKHPVGLDEAVNDFERATIQSAENNHRVQIVGLWGMGGSGKTTLAKHFYNNKYKTMERFGFLFDVREAAAKGELHNKQKELLEGLGLRGVQVNSIEVGKDMLASELRSVRVLIVVDDVDDVEQLDALLPNTDSLGWGSLVVVTTREFEVLRSWGISTVYKMKPLDPHYAEQLFCWHAFLQSSPFQGFESLVKSFLNVCDGLPLSLKIFGAQLYGNSSKDYWKHQLDKISRILPKNVIGRLKVSYDALDDEEKEIFLDIACFFIGEKKNLVINVWDGSKWNGLHCWERLFNKCLVELDDNDHIRMHDHLRDLGREIANQQSPYRLWFPHQIIKIYDQTQSIRIRGISSTTAGSTSGSEEFPRCSLGGEVMVDTNRGPYSLAPSSLGLKIFQVKRNYYKQIIADVSRELLWLRCFDIRQRNLRSFISLANLRVLELHEQQADSHLEELWETDSDAPVQLRGLIISGCYNFKRFPDSIGCLSHLKTVVLKSARSLRGLPKEFCLLRWLEHLQIEWCVKLSSLPDSFGNLNNLRHLGLEGCQQLSTLPHSFKDLILLEHLDLNQCDKLTLRSDILESVRKLQYVNLSGCKQLEVLPSNITNQESLRTLDLRGCRSLWEVPMNIGQLSKLRVMEIGSELLTSLPNSLGDLSSLTDLRIENCPGLESLPDSVGCLNLLENLYIIFSGVTSLPISVRQLSNLHTLAIDNSLTSELNLGTGSFTFSLCQLKCMYLSSIKVHKISISQDSCPGLETLQILNIHNLREIEVLPTTIKELDLRRCGNLRDIRGIAGLVSIRKLIIETCPELDVLPCFAQSASLQEFVFRGCYGVKKIQGLEYCKALKELRADTKWEVQGIESLEPLEKLKCVELRANRRSGVESCIQSMQKWPGEILLCTRAVSDAVSLVNSFAFPTMYLVDSFTSKNIHSKTVLVQERLPSEDAIIVCFVVNCTCRSMILNMILKISSMNSHMFSTEVEEGRWFWIGLFTQRSRNHVAQMYNINTYSGEGEVEKGLLLMGEEQRLMQAIRDLWALLAN
ncbi:disease resistance protein RUN1 isoform X2 [Cryptomeria japonica]|uniref:disease resistance protein RUN1 isoform X2 n=1 Tax=Cryptomeria japonica TaxID=3369 RepID=UPI0027DA4BAD|nr:disease resistance protein RUN1 isoform X2 [Cryptomeria japonica]